MKKIMRLLFLGILFSLTGCVYIGLFPNELKKHNSAIQEQIVDFPFENFSIDFSYFPEEEKTAEINCINGVFEILEFIEGKMIYNCDGEEICYDVKTKEEVTYKKDIKEYSYYEDALELIEVIKNYQNLSGKTRGVRGSDEDEDGILDEVAHYFYNMEWEYLDCAELDFYVTSDTSLIKWMLFMDHTKNWELDRKRRHFIMRVFLNSENNLHSLKDNYDYQKEMYEEFEKQEEEEKEDKVDLSFYFSGLISFAIGVKNIFLISTKFFV